MKGIKSYLFFIIVVFQLSSCSSVQPIVSSDSVSNSTAAEAERNRRLWRKGRIENYDFEVKRSAEGMGGDWTLKFNVRNNQTLPVKVDNDFKDLFAHQYEEINSLEKLFDYIERWSNEEYDVKATFNKEYGIPESVIILRKNSNGRVSIEIKQFEIVK